MAPASATVVIAVMLLARVSYSEAQQCNEGTGILVLDDPGRCRGVTVLEECLSKLQVTSNARCNATLTPNMPVATDGSYCKPSLGQLKYGAVSGWYNVGRNLKFSMTTNSNGQIVIAMNGPVPPPNGGAEKDVNCKMTFNVTGGVVMDIASVGTDSLNINGSDYQGWIGDSGAPPPLSNGGGAVLNIGALLLAVLLLVAQVMV